MQRPENFIGGFGKIPVSTQNQYVHIALIEYLISHWRFEI